MSLGFVSATLQCPAHLQRDHRVSARCLMYPGQRRPGQRRRQPRTNDLLQSAHRYRSDTQTCTRQAETGFLSAAFRIGRQSLRSKNTNPLCAHPVQSERQHGPRGPVQPLNVINGQDQRLCSGHQPQDSKNSHAHDPITWRTHRGALDEQRRRQRPPLHVGQLGKNLLGSLLEQITQPRECPRRVRGSASARTNHNPPPSCRADAFGPDRGLSDTGKTFQHQTRSETIRRRDEAIDDSQLSLSSNDSRSGINHIHTIRHPCRRVSVALGRGEARFVVDRPRLGRTGF